MKSVNTEKVVKVLENLGFQVRPGKGNGRGYHVPMIDSQGREIAPKLVGDRMHHGHLHPLRDTLEGLGVIEKRSFMAMIRAA